MLRDLHDHIFKPVKTKAKSKQLKLLKIAKLAEIKNSRELPTKLLKSES